jgi:hypothetical protein
VSTYSYTNKFFNNEAGELFIVYNNYNGCTENSDLDVGNHTGHDRHGIM